MAGAGIESGGGMGGYRGVFIRGRGVLAVRVPHLPFGCPHY